MRLLDDLEARACARLPAEVYDYFAGGAGDERSLVEAPEAWRHWWLVPRHLTGATEPSTAVTLLGHALAAPILVAPMAAQRLLHPDGEVAMARAAAEAGLGSCLSTRATAEPEEVAAAAPGGARLFQLYVDADRAQAERLLARVAAAGFSPIGPTADLPVAGRRERGTAPLALPDGVAIAGETGAKPPVGGWARLSWEDVGWVARASGLPVLVKGILSGHDAARALDAGAAGVVVSTHGARQLDGVVPSAAALPEVVAAAAGRAAVLVDGGIRCGADVVRALALGADGVLVGRPCAWGLAADGQAGVAAVLGALVEDLARTLALVGAAGVDEVQPHHVRARWTA